MYLGIDLGTGSVKALLLDADGQTVGESSRPYRVESPHPGWAESDPECWWQGVIESVRDCLAGRPVTAIGLSGQMHGVVLSDAEGQPLRPAILWADARSGAQLQRFRELSQDQRRRLANPPATGMAGPSLLWLRDHEPALYGQARWCLCPKDWLRLRLTGQAHCEPSDASATLLYDIPADTWAWELLETLDLRRDWLPVLLPSTAVAGGLTAPAAAALGLAPGTPVAAGAADSAAGLLGNGVVEPGSVQLQVGTGMQLLTARSTPVVDPELRTHLYRACGPGWYAMAAMQNGGVALEWVRSQFGLSWEAMYREGFSAPAGSDGLLFLPYLCGERSPHLNPDACGAWLGLRLHHGRAQLLRAAFEGVVFSLRDGLAALEATGIKARELRLAGGGNRDPRWRQLLADSLGRPLLAGPETAASARGAALLGALAVGGFADITAAAALAPRPEPVAGPRAVPALEEAYRRFREAYNRTVPTVPASGK